MKDRCDGCRCNTCRWKAAGSLCYYNEHGVFTSRCSWCLNFIKKDGISSWKTHSYGCKGYQKKFVRA